MQCRWHRAERLIVPRQTHSVNCVTIDRLPVDNDTLQGVDALVTSLDNTAIGISTADCVPVLMADPVNRIIAAAHAGWRGAIRGIANVTLSEMLANGADISCIKSQWGRVYAADASRWAMKWHRNSPQAA